MQTGALPARKDGVPSAVAVRVGTHQCNITDVPIERAGRLASMRIAALARKRQMQSEWALVELDADRSQLRTQRAHDVEKACRHDRRADPGNTGPAKTAHDVERYARRRDVQLGADAMKRCNLGQRPRTNERERRMDVLRQYGAAVHALRNDLRQLAKRPLQ